MIEHWFPTLLYQQDLSKQFGKNFNEKVFNRIKEIDEKSDRVLKWECKTQATLGLVDLTKEKLFEPLLHTCGLHVLNFAREFGIDESKTLKCIDLWGNIAKPGDYQEKHVHPISHFSLIYYVRCPENCGNTYFYSPITNDMYPLPISHHNKNTFTNFNIKPTESRLVIFRSNVLHMVAQNNSNQDRCSLAMNFRFE